MKIVHVIALALVAQTAHAANPEEAFFKANLKADTRLVVIGESHETPASNQAERNSLEALKKLDSSFNCYFAEWDSSDYPLFKSFNKGKDYAKTIQKAVTDFSNDFGPGSNLVPGNLMTKARDLKFTIIPIDMNWRSQTGDPVVKEVMAGKLFHYLNDRSQIMARNIAKVFHSHVCNRAVLVIGSAHVYDTSIEDKPVTTLPQQLEKLGVQAQSFEAPPRNYSQSSLLP